MKSLYFWCSTSFICVNFLSEITIFGSEITAFLKGGSPKSVSLDGVFVSVTLEPHELKQGKFAKES